MAYTYDNFTQAATQAGMLEGFSDDDLKIAQSNPEYGMSVLKLRQDAAAATTTEQKLLAQEAENQLRSSYGGIINAGSGYSYGKQTEYQKLLDEVSGYKGFQYDVESDPRYSAYKKNYLREADRARADTLAKVSAASGGVPSSWAVSAAAQAGNYYTGKLNDAIPSLYNDALSQYLNEYNAKLNALGTLQSDRNFDYNLYLQQAEQKQQQWNNAMALYQQGIDTPEIRNILGIPLEDNKAAAEPEKKKGGGTAPAKNQDGIGYNEILEAARIGMSGGNSKDVGDMLGAFVGSGDISNQQRQEIVKKTAKELPQEQIWKRNG